MTLLLTLALTIINTFTAFPSMLKVFEVLESYKMERTPVTYDLFKTWFTPTELDLILVTETWL